MARIGTMMVLVSLLLWSDLWAETVYVAVPGLLGTYPMEPPDATRTAAFQLPQPPTVVHGASIWIKGTMQLGLEMCESGGPYESWPMDLGSYMIDDAGEWWSALAQSPSSTGPFSWEAQFTSYLRPGAATWSFLLDGEGEISFYAAPAPFLYDDYCWPAHPWPEGWPTATIQAAYLIIDADFPVTAHGATWSRIKAQYR